MIDNNNSAPFQQRILTAYSRRPVLVTGAEGFVGSHLVDLLVEAGAQVTALVKPGVDTLGNLDSVRDKITLHKVDIRRFEQIHEAVSSLKDTPAAVVFHLAAHTHVGDSWTHPQETIETNVLGTLNLLWALRESRRQLHRIVYAGSSEEYGSLDTLKEAHYLQRKNGHILLNETSPLNPKSIYATSKVAADFLARNFFDAYGLPTVVTRMFNNYGPRQSPRFITGTVITQALTRATVEIGWPHGARDFTYVRDGVWGLLAGGLYGDPGGVYVFGFGKNITIGEWAQLILQVGAQHGFWPAKELHTREDRFRPGRTDQAQPLADARKLREISGWQPAVSWEEGILETIRWYAENRTKWERQIDWQ